MPSTYAHRRFGADVLALLPDGLRATLEQALRLNLKPRMPRGCVLLCAGTPLDAELLPIGVEAAVDGANRSAGTRQTGVVGAHANLSGQPAFDARTAEMNAAAKCRLDVETQAAHDLALANSVSGRLLPADDDVVRQARPPRLGQRPEAGIDAQLAAYI